ncbi:unnamed protein product [Caenorhabditis auriculariae]|uniref:Ubiquitin carboxyl-terminal hydrolase n=1 Tax=Caenorhabditis auriculariae TaxID=2777116 RepID=A0A8S1HL14_9PELO|nr:unnamed protein product [Caenorhabditis auriculariae]
MAADAGNWCLIESDPGVFTEMLQGLGVSGVQVEELYSLQDYETGLLKPVYGLIFLFKWRPGDEISGHPAPEATNVFYAQQVITNACATQALVNMLMNIDDPNVKLGSVLSEYKEFTKDFDASTRGLCLSNSESIRSVHNSFARPTLYEIDVKGGRDEDNFHFICYVPVGNQVFELDGLRDYPIKVADIPENKEWLECVRPVIQNRMDKYNEGEIHFNLMALIPNRKENLQAMLERIEEANENDCLAEQIEDIKRGIADEDYKMKLYRKENARRRHNYLPFILELMKALAKEGKLVGLVDKAIETAYERAGVLTTEKTMLQLKRKQ